MMKRLRTALATAAAGALIVFGAVVAQGDGNGHSHQGNGHGQPGTSGDQGGGHGNSGNPGNHGNGKQGNGTCNQNCVQLAKDCRSAARSGRKDCCAAEQQALMQACRQGDGVSDNGQGDGVSDNGQGDGVSDNGQGDDDNGQGDDDNNGGVPSADCQAAIQALQACTKTCVSNFRETMKNCVDGLKTCRQRNCGLPSGPPATPSS